MNIQCLLSKKIKNALIAVGASKDCRSRVRCSSKIQFGDYQAEGIMTEARKLNISPIDLANKVLTHLHLAGIVSKIEVLSPGFINIFLDPKFLAANVDIALKSKSLGIKQRQQQTIVVDYSAPNIAKEMHVGHLRSTIIGDAVVRTLNLLNHKVIRVNHIGDWGTQFGMLIGWFEKKYKENYSKILLEDLENFYIEAKRCYDEDGIFAELARNYVVRLQSGDEYLLQLWRKLVDITMHQNQIIYDRLNVTLTHDNIIGESFYNSMLPKVVADLKDKGLAVENEGATVVFLNEFKNREGKPMGVIIQKKDGGYLYITTEIACVKYRYEKLHADRILYYIDSRQHQHLMQAWTIARKVGYIPNSVSLEHHMFGMMLDKNRKPFKTRTGDTIKLSDLLDEALERAYNLVSKRNPNMSKDELEKLANVIGIGALKYADLSKNRNTDYIFDWDKMLSFEGNTAPYIQYAYTRITSILRKVKIDEYEIFETKTIFIEDKEIRLATCLLQFEEILEVVARDGTPHVMCSYLYNLAGLFSNFYEHCPIISSKIKDTYNSRLKLALLTAKTLKLGLDTLGIETVERM